MLTGLNSKQMYFGVDQGFTFWAGLQRHLHSAPCTPDVCLASCARGPPRARGRGSVSAGRCWAPFQLAAECGEHSLRSTACGAQTAAGTGPSSACSRSSACTRQLLMLWCHSEGLEAVLLLLLLPFWQGLVA